MSTTSTVRGDTNAALTFIKEFRPKGTICLVSITPDGPTETRTFDVMDTVGLRDWIDARQGRMNIYFTPNEVKGYPSKKPSKSDMVEARAL